MKIEIGQPPPPYNRILNPACPQTLGSSRTFPDIPLMIGHHTPGARPSRRTLKGDLFVDGNFHPCGETILEIFYPNILS